MKYWSSAPEDEARLGLKIAQSPLVDALLAPGNGGIADVAECVPIG